MKKLLFSLTFLAGLSVSAQVKVIKDFTLTDLNGNSHNLYDYLDQGKTVIIDISAAWCGPCWSFHNSGTLEELHANHGPAGQPGVLATTTDDMVVFFMEGETANTTAQLHGVQGTGSAGSTQGDWVTGTPYPIIDLPNGNLMSELGLTAFPSIYKICPNRQVLEVGRLTVEAYHAMATSCPAASFDQVDLAYLQTTSKSKICGPANYQPKIEIVNEGMDVIKSATISIKVGGVEVSTGAYNSTTGIGRYASASVTCTSIANFMGGDMDITITTDGDLDASNNNPTFLVKPAPEVTNQIKLFVTTDGYPDETSWRIKASTGATVAGTNVAAGALTQANHDYVYEYYLTSAGCYTLVAGDTYGDGTGEFFVRDGNYNLIYKDNTLGYAKTVDIPFKVTQTLSVEETAAGMVGVFPNPTNGALTIKGENLKSYESVSLVDQLGRTLNSWTVNNAGMDIDLASYAEGTYLLVFKGATAERIQQVQLRK